MVKHNNQIPNIHCKKKYCESSRGPLKVKLALKQATRKKARRVKRAAKAARIAPAPLERLRPVVHCPTQRYSSKVRLGKGFTLEELKAAQLHPTYAMTVGIAIDWRRRNKSEESLALNLARLEAYKKSLVVLKKNKKTEGAGTEEITLPPQFKGVIQPITKPDAAIDMQEVTTEMKDFKAVTTLRVARQETRVAGYRIAVVNRKKNE